MVFTGLLGLFQLLYRRLRRRRRKVDEFTGDTKGLKGWRGVDEERAKRLRNSLGYWLTSNL